MLSFRLIAPFIVPDLQPPMAKARLSALKQQVPLLYLIITINSVALGATHYGTAPLALILVPVFVLAAVSIGRALFWVRLDLDALPQEQHVPLLRRTNRLTAILSPSILLWALAVEHFDAASNDVHILFFLALTAIGCIFCLTHLRSAALTIASAIIVPTAGIALRAHQPELTAIAVNLLLVGMVILRVLTIKHREFDAYVEQTEALRSLSEENMRLADTDMLTGLPNRRTFFPALDRMVTRCRDGRRTFLLASIDLDGFKNINDTFGHTAGDRVLVAFAERLAARLPACALLARVGGDEFAIIAEDDDASDVLTSLIRSIRAAVAEPIRSADNVVRVGASTGLARWKAGQAGSDLIERADFALYEAKAGGSNTAVLFADQHEAAMRFNAAIESSLRNAHLASELDLVFQPIVDVERRCTVAFEALARWASPQLGHVPPDSFIVAAERIGMINDVTRILLAKLLGLMADWPKHIVISFNLSVSDIISEVAIEAIIEMVEASGIEPARLHFEVTETAMLTDFSLARSGLDRLKAMGSSLSLDDFGTGHSSLSHVHHLPVDKLKIDGSFTREMLTHDTARNIVASIVGLGHGLRMDCIVEGVETIDQMNLLRGLGCRLMQGWLFSRPIGAAEVCAYAAMEGATFEGAFR